MSKGAEMTLYDDRIRRGRNQHGEKWDASELDARDDLIHWYNRHCRVRVVTTFSDGSTYERTGTVSTTTGRRPGWLLMHRSSDHGSSDLLGDRDRVTHFQGRRAYVPVSNDSSASH